MKKLTYLFGLSIALIFSQCKKNEVNFDKFNDVTIKPEVLTPLANARVIASDILKQDDIIQYDPDGLIRLTFKQDSVFQLSADSILKDVALAGATSVFKIGELSITGQKETTSQTLDQMSQSANDTAKLLLQMANGTTDTFPAVKSDLLTITNLAQSADYESVKLSNGYLVFSMINGMPTTINKIQIGIYDNVPTQTLLGTATFTNVLPGATGKDSIYLGGKTLSNQLGYNIPSIDIAKSLAPVLIDLQDEVTIEVTYNNMKCIGGKAKIPQQILPVQNITLDLSDPNLDARIKNLKFTTAVLPIKTTSSINTTVKVGLELPDATVNGNTIDKKEITVPTGFVNSSVDLSGAQIYLGADTAKEYNILRMAVYTEVAASSGLVTFDSSDYIQIDFDASGARFDYIDGYLGSKTFNINIENMDVSQLAELGKGITMANPSMHVYVDNSFGFPILVKLNITAKDAQGNALPMNAPDMAFPYPTIAEKGQTKSETFAIDKTNSKIVECLGMPAVLFDVKGQALMNPDGFTGQYLDHITQSSAINIGFDADIPMTLIAKDFKFSDTLKEGASLQNLQDFEFMELKIKTINGFPLGGSLDLDFTDINYKSITKLTDVTLLSSAVVDINGRPTKTSENISVIALNNNTLKKLNEKKVEYIIIKTNFNTYDNGNQPVSIYTDCRLDISLALRLKLTQQF
ncbi:MAG: hypothetical protein NBV77_02485 [Bacteroidia bacterium]|nr:hypothetical protein [Bacteroidia bacterium]